MINLRVLARPAIRAINPDQPVVILASQGWGQDENYQPAPLWAAAVEVMAQPQPVPDKTLQFLAQQRQNTIWHDFYLPGEWEGLVRADGRGGDLIYWRGYEWQADQVLERWNPDGEGERGMGWTKIRCVQLRACPPPEAGATEPAVPEPPLPEPPSPEPATQGGNA